MSKRYKSAADLLRGWLDDYVKLTESPQYRYWASSRGFDFRSTATKRAMDLMRDAIGTGYYGPSGEATHEQVMQMFATAIAAAEEEATS